MIRPSPVRETTKSRWSALIGGNRASWIADRDPEDERGRMARDRGAPAGLGEHLVRRGAARDRAQSALPLPRRRRGRRANRDRADLPKRDNRDNDEARLGPGPDARGWE